jgi:hypothetical protein
MAKFHKTGGYSREFSVVHGRGKRYLLDAIPPDLWTRFQAKCQSQKVSVRTQLLRMARRWAEK